MRIPAQGRQHGLRFNITPLIDIVFLLIIFFLVASYLSRSENSEQIELAGAATGKFEPPEAPARLVVTVQADETMHVAGRAITAAEFTQLLAAESVAHKGRELEVRIRADRRVPYRVIEPLMTACAEAGIRKVRFHVLTK